MSKLQNLGDFSNSRANMRFLRWSNKHQSGNTSMGIGRRGRGAFPPGFYNFSKKSFFLSFEWVKTNFTTFGPVQERFWENLLVPPWKKSFRRPWTQLIGVSHYQSSARNKWFITLWELIKIDLSRYDVVCEFSFEKILWSTDSPKGICTNLTTAFYQTFLDIGCSLNKNLYGVCEKLSTFLKTLLLCHSHER